MRLVQSSSSILLILVLVALGCSTKSQGNDVECGVEYRSAVLNVWESESDSQREKSALDLQRVIESCPFPESGVLIALDVYVKEAEVYILAMLNDKAKASLTTVQSLSEAEKASLLFTATRYGDIKNLRDVIDSGIGPNLMDPVGNNASFETAGFVRDADKKLEYLYRLGVDPLSTNKRDLSALDGAVLAGNRERIEQILALVEPRGEEAFTAVRRALEIAEATESDNSELLETWLESNAK